jgi:alpha-amylase
MTLIVQMFDLPFKKVAGKIPALAKLGVTHLLVSPPQKSNPSDSWWGRYQPVDYTCIDGPLGNWEDLYSLCQKAAKKGMSVMADAVLNHMTNHPWYISRYRGRVVETAFPRFGVNDFHTPETENAYGREKYGGRGRHALPELRTDLPYVQQELKNYLHGLVGLGVRGFRFDAAKHISASFWPFALEGLDECLNFGELVHTNASQYNPYLFNFMMATDFPFAALLKESFSHGGDLRELLNPEAADRAIGGPRSIRFTNTHDFARRGAGFKFFKLSSAHDRALANVFILGTNEGVPCLYYNDLKNHFVKDAMKFRNCFGEGNDAVVYADPNTLIWRKGDFALIGINKAGYYFYPQEPIFTGLREGYYHVPGQEGVFINSNGLWEKPAIPPRSAVFLVP